MFILITLGIICLMMAAILFARIAVTLVFELVPGEKKVSLVMHWMHPLVLRGVIDVKTKILEIWLFKKIRVWPVKKPKKNSGPIETQASTHSLSSQSSNVNEQREPFWKDPEPADRKPADENKPDEKRSASNEKTDTAKRKSLKEKIAGAIGIIKKSKLMKAFFIIRDTQILSKGLRWIRRCLRSLLRLVSIHSLAVHVRTGLGDPALTAKVFGYCTGMQGAGILSATNQLDLTFEPLFNEESFSIKGNLSLQSSLMRFAMLLSIAVATFPYITAIKIWRMSRRKEK